MTRVLVKDLWCLFRLGALVVSKPYLNEPQLFRFSDCECKEEKDEKTFVLIAWAFSWTGTELIQQYYNSTTGEYKKTNKEMTITDLPCYPI